MYQVQSQLNQFGENSSLHPALTERRCKVQLTARRVVDICLHFYHSGMWV